MGSHGGDEGSRTPDLLNAIQALSQLSYIPEATSCWLTASFIILIGRDSVKNLAKAQAR